MEAITAASDESELPFSDAIRHGDTIYVSGQGPLDADTGEVVGDDVAEQTRVTLENVSRILTAGGSTLDRVVKATVYLQDMDDYETVNEAYSAVFSEPYPARTAVEIVDLPVDIMVEIDVIAAA